MPPDYSPAGLAAAAGVDPWALHRKLADGKPTRYGPPAPGSAAREPPPARR